MSHVAVDENLKSAPKAAFAFESSCEFAQPSARDSASKLRRAKVSMLARTGEPVYHWYWGWIVHDMAGMKAPDKIALDYRHDGDQIIGYADKITARNDLKIEGELLSRSEEDIAATVMDLGAAGVPYQCSIQFNPYSVLLEYVPDQAKTKVNGLEVTGPCVIVREWELQRCAVTPTGVDGGTSTKFSESAEATQFSLRWKDSSAMTKTTTTAPAGAGQQSQPATSPATTASTPATATTPAAGQQSQPATVSTETTVNASSFEAEFRAKMKRYIDRFGAENGAKYFADGVSYEGALEQYCDKLKTDLQASFTANEELKTKLSQLNLGETTPVNTGTQSGKETKTAKFEDAFKSRDKSREAK